MLYFQKISFQIIYCRNMSDAAIFIFDNIYIRHVKFDPTLYRHIVGIRMGTKYAPLVADFFVAMKYISCCLFLGLRKMKV